MYLPTTLAIFSLMVTVHGILMGNDYAENGEMIMQMHKSINVGPSGQVNRIQDKEKQDAAKHKHHKQDLIQAYLRRKQKNKHTR